MSRQKTPRKDYAVNYQLPRTTYDVGILTVNGLRMTAAEFYPTKAFLVSSEPRDVHGHNGFIGDGWNQTGPFVAAWHEPDDLVVWVAGLGITKDQTITTAQASTETNTRTSQTNHTTQSRMQQLDKH
jgi:hypothetical protein